MAKTSAPAADVKTIVLVRHSKSAWGLDVADHERPLSGRGKRDAAALGHHLTSAGLLPGAVVCSTAVRARDTWTRALKGGATQAPVQYLERVYEGEARDLTRVLRGTSDDVSTVLMVGHAPGIPDLVEHLAARTKGKAWKQLDTKFPTSALAVLHFTGSWADLGRDQAELVNIDIPRGAKKPAKSKASVKGEQPEKAKKNR